MYFTLYSYRACLVANSVRACALQGAYLSVLNELSGQFGVYIGEGREQCVDPAVAVDRIVCTPPVRRDGLALEQVVVSSVFQFM